MQWQAKTHEDYTSERGDYWEWESNPPDRESYRPYKDEEGTWYQLYETVSEGTPGDSSVCY